MTDNKLKLRGKQAKADRLQWIYEDNGNQLEPESVVADAADPDSPLHDAFIWDDTEAAHKYRLDQARGLIRWVKYESKLVSHTVSVPKYVSYGTEQADSGYESIEDVAKDVAKSEQVFMRELRAVQGHLERADSIGGSLGYDGKLKKAVSCVNKLLDEMSG